MLHFRDRSPPAVAVLVGALEFEWLDATTRGAQLNVVAVPSHVNALQRLSVRLSPWVRRTAMCGVTREQAQH
jgi:hypothetical protein